MKSNHPHSALLVVLAVAASAPAYGEVKCTSPGTVCNAACPAEAVFYDPGKGQDIAVPRGYTVSVFAKNLNFPTGLAFVGSKKHFNVLVVESGQGLPSACNNNEAPVWGGKFSKGNPFTPDLLIFDQNGKLLAGPLAKPTASGGGYQPDGPAIGLAFEHGFNGGTLFATDSNQGVRGAPGNGNNTSRVITIALPSGNVTPFINGLPTGDHPTELIVVKDGYIYWSQGSATNSGVTGHDNGGGGNQHDIACQDITLSDNVWCSGDGHCTAGYSNHGDTRPGSKNVRAFEDATNDGMCTGAILRAPIHAAHPQKSVQPFSWGYRNPFGLQFAPADHPLRGGLFVTENGEDERGARPTNNAPDRLQLARMNRDGTPDYHGWPDRFGDLDSTQAVFNPIGGPGDDLPTPLVLAMDRPVRHVLAFLPQPPVAPLAVEPTDVAAVGPDFAPDSFVHGVVKKGAALVAREGDFGFSPGNGEPEAGHDIELVNFKDPLTLSLSRFAFNCKSENQRYGPGGAADCTDPEDQAFAASTGDRIIHGINRPIQVLFGPDGALYLVDFGAVRDFGQSDPRSKFIGPGDGPLAQIPGTGVIWKITRTDNDRDDDDD